MFLNNKKSQVKLFSNLILGCMFFFSCSSCNNVGKNQSEINMKIKFKSNLGQLYNYDVCETKEVRQQIGGKEAVVISTIENKMNFSSEAIGNSKDANNAIIQFNTFSLNDKSKDYLNMQEQDGFLDNNVFQNGVKAIEGLQFKINLTNSGCVDSINGYEIFKQRFDSIANSPINNNKGNLEALREDYFKDIFQRISCILPDTGAAINSSWMRWDSESLGDTPSIKSNYELYKIANGLAHIKVFAKVEKELKALNGILIMSGIETGEIKLEVESGMVISSEKALTLTGSMKIGKANLLMNVNRKTVITGVRSTI